MVIKYEQISVDIWLVLSVLLLDSHTWIMLNICQLLNWTPQLDNTSLAVVQCVCKKSISNYRKHTSAKHHQLKVKESLVVLNVYKCNWYPLYEEYLVWLCVCVCVYIWRVQMQKPLNAIWNFLLKWWFLSNLYI